MGRGNWIPNDETPREFVYIDWLNIWNEDGETDDIDVDTLPMLFEMVMEILPDSFGYAPERSYNSVPEVSNGLMEVSIKPDSPYIVLVVRVKEGAPAFAEYQMKIVAENLFNSLAKCFSLRVPTSIWTSRQYIPTDLE